MVQLYHEQMYKPIANNGSNEDKEDDFAWYNTYTTATFMMFITFDEREIFPKTI